MAPSQHDPDDDEDHGGLVKKILETKKELEGGSQTSQAKQNRRTEIVRTIQSEKFTKVLFTPNFSVNIESMLG